MAIYFDQINYLKAPIDRHFVDEHFGILFAFFGLMVQKLLNFKVQFNFCHLFKFPAFTRNVFAPGVG